MAPPTFGRRSSGAAGTAAAASAIAASSSGSSGTSGSANPAPPLPTGNLSPHASPGTSTSAVFPSAMSQYHASLADHQQSAHTAHGTIVNLSDASLRETFARRTRALGYIKRCLSTAGDPLGSQTQPWLDIIQVSRRDLLAFYETDVMRKRASRYYLLGCSLAPTLELTSSSEFARAVLTVMNEVESMGEGGEKDKTRMRNFFKSSLRGPKRVGLAEFASTFDGVGVGGPPLSTLGATGVELVGTHVPFPLDFLQTTIGLCDVLMEVYYKFTLFLSPGTRDADGLPASDTASSASTADCMSKIDVRVRKILAQICKELDGLARNLIREELASIDPLMVRDMGGFDGGGSLSPAPMSGASVNAGPISIHGDLHTGSAPNLLTVGQGPTTPSIS